LVIQVENLVKTCGQIRAVDGITFRSNQGDTFGMVILGTLTFVSIGCLAISRAKTTGSAMPIIQLLQLPMLFLSGVFSLIEIMPSFMKPIVAVMPLSYQGNGLRQIRVEATPPESAAGERAGAGRLVRCIVSAGDKIFQVGIESRLI